MKSSRSGMKAIRLFNQQTLGFMAFHADEMRMMRPSDVKAMSTTMMGHRSVLCTPNRQDEPGLGPQRILANLQGVEDLTGTHQALPHRPQTR